MKKNATFIKYITLTLIFVFSFSFGFASFIENNLNLEINSQIEIHTGDVQSKNEIFKEISLTQTKFSKYGFVDEEKRITENTFTINLSFTLQYIENYYNEFKEGIKMTISLGKNFKLSDLEQNDLFNSTSFNSASFKCLSVTMDSQDLIIENYLSIENVYLDSGNCVVDLTIYNYDSYLSNVIFNFEYLYNIAQVVNGDFLTNVYNKIIAIENPKFLLEVKI